MTATDLAKALAAFRIIAKEFATMPNADVEAQLEFYSEMVSRKRFGVYYHKAVAALAAHYITLGNLAEAEGGSGGMLTGGSLTSEKEGDLARGYGSVSTASSSDDPDALYDKSVYGKLFLSIRSLCIVPATVRKGVGAVCGC